MQPAALAASLFGANARCEHAELRNLKSAECSSEFIENKGAEKVLLMSY